MSIFKELQRPMRICKDKWKDFKAKASIYNFKPTSSFTQGMSYYEHKVNKSVTLRILVPLDTSNKELSYSPDNSLGQLQINRSGQLDSTGSNDKCIAYLYEELEIINSLFPLFQDNMFENGK